ncbi:MAG: SMC-Scp complex subunit ScpB [Candidatus Eisenbacteria bacterium]
MDALELVPVLEALLFAAAEPLTAVQLAEACEVDAALVAEAMALLSATYDAAGRGIKIAEEAQGFIVITRPDYAPYVARLLRGRKKMRLSRPALETLAIIAYKQPVTKGEVDAIRGVDSSGVLNTLLERSLVTIRGRSKAIGRPLLYGTTGDFLSYFGLRDLNELPRVEELKAIVGEREPENADAEPDPLVLPFPSPPGEDDPLRGLDALDEMSDDPDFPAVAVLHAADQPAELPEDEDESRPDPA